MASANEVTVKRLKEHNSSNVTLVKYAELGKLFSGEDQKSQFYYVDRFIEILAEWTETMNISRLGKYGIKHSDIEKIVNITDVKNNPVKLGKEDLMMILEARL